MPKQIDSFNIVQRRSVLQENRVFREKIVNVICNLEISKNTISLCMLLLGRCIS